MKAKELKVSILQLAFEIPKSWAWVRLGLISKMVYVRHWHDESGQRQLGGRNERQTIEITN